MIGTVKMAFDAWGTCVNVASRMESTGVAGRIQLSRNTFQLLHDQYRFESRGLVKVKGIGEMQTYLFAGRLGTDEPERGVLGVDVGAACTESVVGESTSAGTSESSSVSRGENPFGSPQAKHLRTRSGPGSRTSN